MRSLRMSEGWYGFAIATEPERSLLLMPSKSSPMSSGRATDAATQLSSVQRSAGCVRIIFLCRKKDNWLCGEGGE